MPEKEFFYVTQKIQVGFPDRQDDQYASSVQDIKNDELYISIPVKETKSLTLFINEMVELHVFEEMARFVFTAKVLRRVQDNIPMYVLNKPTEYQRIQLREYFRVPVSLQVAYAHLPRKGKEPVFTWTESLDLSAGGTRLAVGEGLEKDDRLIMEFTLIVNEQPEHFRIYGQVERILTDDEGNFRQVAVRFVNVNSKQVDKITRYLFAVMLENKRTKLETI